MQNQALLQSSFPASTTPFIEPRIVSIHHDGVEVVRIVDGSIAIQTVTNAQPRLLEICWDGRLVYRMLDGTPEYNVMTTELQAYQSL